MKKIMIIAFCAILFAFCAKDEPAVADCEVKKTGNLIVSNSSSDSYRIFVRGVDKGILEGKKILTIENIAEGNSVAVKAEQVTGFIFFPTIKEGSVNVLRCSNYSWQIP